MSKTNLYIKIIITLFTENTKNIIDYTIKYSNYYYNNNKNSKLYYDR